MGVIPEQFANGQSAFASRREPAWHQLGKVFQSDVTTEEMLDLAMLSRWDVRLEQVDAPHGYLNDVEKFFVVRDHPTESVPQVLSIVGSRYNVFQNEELLGFGESLIDGGARWETAGSMDNGRTVFASLALEHETVIDREGVADKIDSYIILSTSHDGTSPLIAAVTPVRVVCQNTLTMALRGATQKYKIRHTQSIQGRARQAQMALTIAHEHMDVFGAEANALYQTKVDDKKFFEIINAAYPKPEQDAKAALTRWEKKVDLINDIYTSETTADIAGTAWGALNALTERLDWFRNPRANNEEKMYAAASGFDVATEREKVRLMNVVKAVA